MPLAGGGRTKPGVLYRSDALSNLTPQGLQQLSGSGISVIVDYRTPAEAQMAPDRLPVSVEFTKVNLPLLEGAFTGTAQEAMQRAGLHPEAAARAVQAALDRLPDLGEVYTGMLQHGAPEFAATARAITSAQGSTLVHCTAGKDRAGVSIALVLDAVGVEQDAVIADYEQSERSLAGEWSERMLGMVASMGVPVNEQIVALVTRAPADAVRTALAWVQEHHGSSAGYLRSGGLTGAGSSGGIDFCADHDGDEVPQEEREQHRQPGTSGGRTPRSRPRPALGSPEAAGGDAFPC